MRRTIFLMLLALCIGIIGVFVFKESLLALPGKIVAQRGHDRRQGPRNFPPGCESIMENAKHQIEPLREQMRTIIRNANQQCRQLQQQQQQQQHQQQNPSPSPSGSP